MDFLAPLITLMNQYLNNYTLSIIIAVCVIFTLTIPFRIFSIKNQRAQRACAPDVERIRKKYNSTALGPAMTDDSHLAPEIRAMSINERDEAMANEISALYKANGYHAFIGLLPTIFTLLLIVILYASISSAIPNEYYSMTMQIAGGFQQYLNIYGVFWLLCALLISSLLAPIEQLIMNLIQKKRLSTSLLILLMQVVFSSGLMIWLFTQATIAISIALTTLSVMSFLLNFLERLFTSRSKSQ